MSVIFEQPWPLLITAGVVFLLVLIFRSIFPQKRHAWQWLLPALLAAAAFGLDFLVETDREKINAVIETGVKAVEEENPDAIEAIIADNYRDSFHITKDDLMRHCRVALAEPLIEKNIKRIQAIEISLPTATAIFTVRLVFDKRSQIYQSFKQQMFVKAEVDLQKQSNGNWLIT
ncbi:MAG: hypothetical protein MUO27_05925, partial [Sedimentisphaerales bacterium]|nr:hypothetical protein [Sedimentisphaerales bacterium]